MEKKKKEKKLDPVKKDLDPFNFVYLCAVHILIRSRVSLNAEIQKNFIRYNIFSR